MPALPGHEAPAPRLRRVRVLRGRTAGRGKGSLTLARIALDAMGGDHAPQAPVTGALQALAELDSGHRIQLVGQTDLIEEELAQLFRGEFNSAPALRGRLDVVEAPDVIEMNDKPSVAVRGKPNSSMAVGLRLQAEGGS